MLSVPFCQSADKERVRLRARERERERERERDGEREIEIEMQNVIRAFKVHHHGAARLSTSLTNSTCSTSARLG